LVGAAVFSGLWNNAKLPIKIQNFKTKSIADAFSNKRFKYFIMAQLDVQRKKKSPTWIWIILFIVLVGVILMLYGGYNKSYQPAELKTTPADTTVKDSTAH
jgi:hypothetical protein